MKFRSPPKKRAYGDQLIPMINVVFLLLIFFMISGTLRSADPSGIKAPLSEHSTPAVPSTILFVNKAGTLILNNREVAAEDLESALTEAQWFETMGSAALPVMFDESMPMTVFADVMATLRATPLQQVELVTEFAAATQN